jgi:hypothetical protein
VINTAIFINQLHIIDSCIIPANGIYQLHWKGHPTGQCIHYKNYIFYHQNGGHRRRRKDIRQTTVQHYWFAPQLFVGIQIGSRSASELGEPVRTAQPPHNLSSIRWSIDNKQRTSESETLCKLILLLNCRLLPTGPPSGRADGDNLARLITLTTLAPFSIWSCRKTKP